jgi:hypothetical protein
MKKLQALIEKVWGHGVVPIPDAVAASKALALIEQHRKKVCIAF